MIRKMLASMLIVLATCAFAYAGATTGDIAVDSQVGGVLNYAEGTNVNAETNVHSVDVKDGGSTGDITVLGTAGEVINVGAGNNVNAETNVGSVKVGD